MQGQALSAIGVRKGESRTRHAAAATGAARHAAHEGRLAGAELSIKKQEISGAQRPADDLAEADGLLFAAERQFHSDLKAFGRNSTRSDEAEAHGVSSRSMKSPAVPCSQ